jgi:hypothetical protein
MYVKSDRLPWKVNRSPSNPTNKNRNNPSMKLIEAKVKGQPRNVSTKHGERSVMDCITADGESLTVWRPAGDSEVMTRANGERVTLSRDSKGKISLVETARSRAEQQWQQPAKLAHRSERSADITDYIERLGKLYSHCFKTASEQLAHSELGRPQIKDVSTTLFIQTVKHFDL